MGLRFPLWLSVISLLATQLEGNIFRGASFWFDFRPASDQMMLHFQIAWMLTSDDLCNDDVIESGRLVAPPSTSLYLYCEEGCQAEVPVTDLYTQCYYYDQVNAWFVGQRTIFYDVGRWRNDTDTIKLGWQGDSWVSGLPQGNEEEWVVKMHANISHRPGFSSLNSSPRSTISPLLDLQTGCTRYYTIVIPVSDPDEDVIRCRFGSNFEECGGVCATFPDSFLDRDTCTLHIGENSLVPDTLYAVAIQIEDFETPYSWKPLSSVPLQFLIRAFSSSMSCQAVPEFILPTPAGGSCMFPDPDTGQITFPIVVQTPQEQTSISHISVTSLTAMRTGRLSMYDDVAGKFVMNVTYTPPVVENDQICTYFCFFAYDSMGRVSEERCICLSTEENLESDHHPAVLYADLAASSYPPKILVGFDTPVRRPSSPAYIRVLTSAGIEIANFSSSSSNVQYSGMTLSFTLNTGPWIPGHILVLEKGVSVEASHQCAVSIPAFLTSSEENEELQFSFLGLLPTTSAPSSTTTPAPTPTPVEPTPPRTPRPSFTISPPLPEQPTTEPTEPTEPTVPSEPTEPSEGGDTGGEGDSGESSEGGDSGGSPGGDNEVEGGDDGSDSNNGGGVTDGNVNEGGTTGGTSDNDIDNNGDNSGDSTGDNIGDNGSNAGDNGDTTGGNGDTTGDSGDNTGDNTGDIGDSTSDNGGNIGDNGDDTDDNGDSMGDIGGNTGDNGDNAGDNGDNMGNNGDNTGDNGGNAGETGDNTGDPGDNTGDNGDNTGDNGDNTGDNGDSTGDNTDDIGDGTSDNGSNIGDNGDSTGDNGSTTGDNGGSTGDNAGNTGDNGDNIGDPSSDMGDGIGDNNQNNLGGNGDSASSNSNSTLTSSAPSVTLPGVGPESSSASTSGGAGHMNITTTNPFLSVTTSTPTSVDGTSNQTDDGTSVQSSTGRDIGWLWIILLLVGVAVVCAVAVLIAVACKKHRNALQRRLSKLNIVAVMHNRMVAARNMISETTRLHSLSEDCTSNSDNLTDNPNQPTAA